MSYALTFPPLPRPGICDPDEEIRSYELKLEGCDAGKKDKSIVIV